MKPASPIRYGRLAAALLFAGISTAALAQPNGAAELAAAIRVSDYDGVTELLRVRVVNPDSLMPDGSTPLSWAVESQDPQMVQLLLRAEASPDAAANPAVAPLMLACEHGNSQIVNLLLDAGAKATIMRDDGITPLTTCAGTVPAADVARLIELGAVVDAAETSGQTPLMWAAAKGRIVNAKLLLAKGARCPISWLGHGGGLVVSTLAFSYDPSSNPAGYLNFLIAKTKINKKEAGVGPP